MSVAHAGISPCHNRADEQSDDAHADPQIVTGAIAFSAPADYPPRNAVEGARTWTR